jgi:hypothetical protein
MALGPIDRGSSGGADGGHRLLLALQLLQGLALGGAATYVAEHAPPGKRGFFTSWVRLGL